MGGVLGTPAWAAPSKVRKQAKRTIRRAALAPVIKSAIVMDLTSGRVLAMKDPDAAVPPASVAKIMTLYLAYEAVAQGRVQWTDLVPVSRRAWRTGGTKMYLEPNTQVTLGELVKGISVVSANDGAVAVAEYLAGDVEHFVMRMNEKAKILGMKNTCFKNPHGLPAKGQLTTARDMMILSKAYLECFPTSLQVHSLQSYTYHNIKQYNRNRLLGRYDGADGIKTGFVCKAGYNIAATAKRGDHRLLAVVMGARSPGVRARETARLLDEGFRMVNSRGA